MDLKTQQVLKIFKSHLRIKKFLTILCYFAIIGGILVYVFYAFNQSNKIKIVRQIKKNASEYKTEKLMTNPRINLQSDNSQIYHIRAKKAFHKDNQEAVLYDVFATGDIGNISAGELKIDEKGDHLVFSKNPVLILNNAKNE